MTAQEIRELKEDKIMEDIFKPYRIFLNHISKIITTKVKEGKCAGIIIKWRRIK